MCFSLQIPRSVHPTLLFATHMPNHETMTNRLSVVYI